MSQSILTVDDSRTMRDMLAHTLEGAGHQVIQAVDGKDGLDKICTQPFDVVITDINMPVMNGIEFIHEVRAQREYATLPILILTTESSEEKKNEGRQAGATGWIVKPFDPDKLLRVIEKVSPST